MKIIGKLWNDNEIEIIEQENEKYALYGWNGESYNHCWKVLDNKGLEKVNDNKEYILKPIYIETENEEFEIIKFEIDY